MLRTARALAAAALLLSLTMTTAAAWGQAGGRDIVDTATAAGNFNTLTEALRSAGLTETLKGPGPFTVFAPTDAAFAKLSSGELEALMKPGNKRKLAAILALHVVPGRLRAADISGRPKAMTLQGTDLLFTTQGGAARVDNARISKTDILCSNGVIHVIDTVLTPKDLVQAAQIAGQFNTLLAAADSAGLTSKLKDPSAQLTLFAPTDKAFDALGARAVENLMQPANHKDLTRTLKYHVLGRPMLLSHRIAPTLEGEKLQIRTARPFTVQGANVILADVRTTNGVIHVIDKVLTPGLPLNGTPRATKADTPIKRGLTPGSGGAPPAPEPRRVSPTADAKRLIESSVARGTKLFNDGKIEETAVLYEQTTRKLLTSHAEALGDAAKMRLRTALTEAREETNPRQRSMDLRRALDEVHRSLRVRQRDPNK